MVECEVGGEGIVRDQVVPVLVLLQAAEGHLGAGDVLLGVLEVRELRRGLAFADLGVWQLETYQGILGPGDALLLVGVGVGVAVDGAGLAAEETVERGADHVGAASLEGVALGAARLEEGGTLLGITCGGDGLANWCCWWACCLVALEGFAALRDAVGRSGPFAGPESGLRPVKMTQESRPARGGLRGRDSVAEHDGFEKTGQPNARQSILRAPRPRLECQWLARAVLRHPRAAGFEVGGADNRNPAGNERKSREGRTSSEAHLDGWVLDLGLW